MLTYTIIPIISWIYSTACTLSGVSSIGRANDDCVKAIGYILYIPFVVCLADVRIKADSLKDQKLREKFIQHNGCPLYLRLKYAIDKLTILIDLCTLY